MANVGGTHDVGINQWGSNSTAMADANQTVSAANADNRYQTATGALTAQRNLVLPLSDGYEWAVTNSTTGGFGVQVIGASGTGIVVAAAKTALIRSDGVNMIRLTADV